MLIDEIQESLDRVELTRLTRLYNTAFARGAAALSDVMGESVEAGSIVAISGTSLSLVAAIPQELLTVTVALSEPINGDTTIVMSADDAAALADRLSGAAAGDDHAWAANMTRALEQFIEATSDEIRSHIATPLRMSASTPAVRDLRTGTLGEPDEMMVRLSLELRIGQLLAVQVHYLMSITAARGLLSLIPGAVPPPPGPRARTRAATRFSSLDISPPAESEASPSEPLRVSDPAPEPAQPMSPAPSEIPAAPIAVQPAIFTALEDVRISPAPRKIDVLMGVPLQMAVEVGRVEVSVRDILHMAPGSVMSLQRPAGEAMTLMLNGRPIGRAEIVEIDGDYGIRIVEVAHMGRPTSLSLEVQPDA